MIQYCSIFLHLPFVSHVKIWDPSRVFFFCITRASIHSKIAGHSLELLPLHQPRRETTPPHMLWRLSIELCVPWNELLVPPFPTSKINVTEKKDHALFLHQYVCSMFHKKLGGRPIYFQRPSAIYDLNV